VFTHGFISITLALRYLSPQGFIIYFNIHKHYYQGRSQTFSFGGALEGPVLQQGELSMVCVGLSERDLNIFGGATGGARQNFGEAVPPLAPP